MDPLGLSRQAHYWSCDWGQRSKFLRQLSAKKGKKKKIKKTKFKEEGLVASPQKNSTSFLTWRVSSPQDDERTHLCSFRPLTQRMGPFLFHPRWTVKATARKPLWNCSIKQIRYPWEHWSSESRLVSATARVLNVEISSSKVPNWASIGENPTTWGEIPLANTSSCPC